MFNKDKSTIHIKKLSAWGTEISELNISGPSTHVHACLHLLLTTSKVPQLKPSGVVPRPADPTVNLLES